VPQPLIVDYADIDVGMELLARDTAVHRLVPMVVVARLPKLLAKVVDRGIVLGEVERCPVLREAVHCARLSSEGLDEHADRHTRGEGVRVDDDVGRDAGFGEGHVDVGVLLGADTLLSVTGGELVADDGRTRNS